MTAADEYPILNWWYYSDTSIHCTCGKYIELGGLSDTPKEFKCENCGQKWQVALIVKMVCENGAP